MQGTCQQLTCCFFRPADDLRYNRSNNSDEDPNYFSSLLAWDAATTAIETRLIERLKGLPPSRVAEVADFVEFLAAREERAAAAARLGEAMAKLDALNLPPLSDDEIDAEVQLLGNPAAKTAE